MTFADTWGTARVNDGNTDNQGPPPEDDYDVVLIDAGAFVARSSGNEVAKFVLRVVSPNQSGWEWTELVNFKNQQAANFAKTTCARVGIDVSQVTTLEHLNMELKALIGNYYAVSVKRNGEYLNGYINGPAQQASQPAPAPQYVGATAGPSSHYTDIDTDEVPF